MNAKQTPLTTSQVAARLGVNPSTVSRLALALGLGTLLTPRTRVFSEREAAKIAAALSPPERRPGRKREVSS